MKRSARVSILHTGILAALLILPAVTAAQEFLLSTDDMVALTPNWDGERFPDGRPKVPDTILERMKSVGIEEAWSVCRGQRYNLQFEGDWKHTHLDPGAVMVGRALTATFMPLRPDIDKVLTDKGHADGHIGGRNSWPIDMLQENDVYVANAFGSVVGGPIIGGNLATAIFNNSNNGVVFDGTVRDLGQIEQMDGFLGFVRGWHPSWNWDNMLTYINHPTRIGNATVMPGDIVLARREGIVFVPPHLAEEVCKSSELVRLRDEFGFARIREGVYTPGQVDQRWSEDMEKDFSRWLEDHIDELPVPKAQIQELLKERTW